MKPTLVVGAILTIAFAFMVNIFGAQLVAFSLQVGRKLGEIVDFYLILILLPDIYSMLASNIDSIGANGTFKLVAPTLLFINTILAFSITYKSLVDTLSAFLNNSSNASITSRVFVLLMPLLKGRKKGKPWGVVYDSVTKLPIDPATVTISTYENGVGEYKQTRITDIEGRFSFLVTPGRYIISANKTHYTFPSKIIVGTKDGKFENVYHGEVIQVENPYIINLNIPLDPAAYDWNQAIKSKRNAIFEFFAARGRPILILFGILTSIFLEIVLGSGSSLILIFVFVFNLFFSRVYIQKELWGTVMRKITGEPVARAVVTAIRQPLNIAIGTATTDYMGRYFLLMSHGLYTLQVEEEAKAGAKPKILARIDNVNVSRGRSVINLNIKV